MTSASVVLVVSPPAVCQSPRAQLGVSGKVKREVGKSRDNRGCAMSSHGLTMILWRQKRLLFTVIIISLCTVHIKKQVIVKILFLYFLYS